jgi:hypothetical protein
LDPVNAVPVGLCDGPRLPLSPRTEGVGVGEDDWLGLTDPLGLTDSLGDSLGLTDSLGDSLGLTDSLGDSLGDGLACTQWLSVRTG